MAKPRYIPMLRRRREGKTDYRKRRSVVMSRRPLFCPRVSGKNISIQFIKPSLGGDRVLTATHSRQLIKFGWKGSRKNLPAAYLTGLLAGLKALKAGVEKAVVYVGVKPYVHGSRLAAAIKGALDAGVEIPVGEESLPPDERIRGEHIARYAEQLAEEDPAKYQRVFSQLLRNGFRPEDYPKHFNEVRSAILSGVRG